MSRSLFEKLRRLEQSVAGTVPTSNENPEVTGGWLRLPNAADCQFIEAGFEQIETPYGVCWRRRTTFDFLTRHGKVSFADAFRTDFSRMEKLAKADLDMDRLRFFDVETNGLGTGAGTFPFLHTVGYFEDDEFSLMQYFLDDYDAEAGVLWALGEFHLQEGTIVVTFNGKSFDWPLLQNRRVLHQLPRLDRAQLDLLHPSRRLWRKQLQSVRLSSLEAHVLAVHRVDDLPGSEAPERYFRYLETRDIRVIEPVMSHNAMDVCSLVSLQVEIARHLNGEQSVLPSNMHLALARWYDVWHDAQAAAAAYQRAIEADDAEWMSHWLYSLFLKRRREHEAACALWSSMALDYPSQVEPLIELAKCYEHKFRDLDKAEQAVVEALRRTVRCERHVESQNELALALKHRLNRIRAKQNRSQ